MKTYLAVALATSIALATTSSYAQNASIRAGVLVCDVEGGTGFVVGSRKDMECTFETTEGDVEDYMGVMSKFGIDIGTTEATTIRWVVFTSTSELADYALQGSYGGISAEATLGVGIGANALIGGSEKSIILQPLSAQAQSGLNIAAGIGAMDLKPL